jgi:hypothetical protein
MPLAMESSSTIISVFQMSTLSMIGTTIQSIVGQSSEAMSGSTTVVVVMPATPVSNNNIALIGGIIGGVVALLLIIGLIVFVVTRNRRRKAKNIQPSNRNDVLMAPAQASSSNYGKLTVHPASNVYDESFLKHTPAAQYNNYRIATANQNQTTTNYEDPSVLSQ